MLGVRKAILLGVHRCRALSRPSLPPRDFSRISSGYLITRLYSGKGVDDESVEDFNEELELLFGSRPQSPSQLGGEQISRGKRLPEREDVSGIKSLSHVDAAGKAAMVNVVDKTDSRRVAVASSLVMLGSEAFYLVAENNIAKGDVLTVAKVAGIHGAKQTSSLIPLCHNILLSGIDVSLTLDEALYAVKIKAEATASGPTGVEMEALTAVTVASLTVYDMCKAVSKDITITNVQLDSKKGGKSGDWSRSG